MKKTLLTITILLVAAATYAQNNPVVQWVQQISGKLNDRGIPVNVDASGNVYLAGYFNDTADFDPGVGKFNLISAGRTDIYITKLDPSGAFLWAKQIGGKSNEQANSLGIDAAGNVYIAGTFNDTVDFDPGANVSKLMTAGGADAFVTKLDPSGNFQWAQRIGGTPNDAGNAVTISPSGSVYVTGYFQGTTNFSVASGITNQTSAGGNDIFVTKLDAAGNFIWFKRMGGTSAEAGQSIAADKNDNVITTGGFVGTADFNPDPSVDTLLTSAGSNDIFISKLDASGNYVWVKQFGAASSDIGISITVDGSGNIFSTGYYGGTVDFDPNAGVSTITSYGFDAYVSKLNAAGQFGWIKNLGGMGADRGASIAVDQYGNVYTTGTFDNIADFDPDPTNTYNITPASITVTDAYISKLDQVGSFVWARSLGGKSDDYGTAIVVDKNSNVYTAGFFSGRAAFNGSSTTDSLISFGSYDAFVHKINDAIVTSTTDELATDNRIQVYPNPASDVIHFSVKNAVSGKATITDIQGGLVTESIINGAETVISIQSLVNGVYLLKIDTDQQHTVQKIVVVK